MFTITGTNAETPANDNAKETPFALEYGVAAPKFVSSRRALAAALGCTEKIVNLMKLEKNNPGTTTNGAYDVNKWLFFYSERQKRLHGEDIFLDPDEPDTKKSLAGELRLATLREKKAKADIAEFTAQQKRGELINAAVAKKEAFSFAAKLKAIHARLLTVDAVNEISIKLGLSAEKTADLVNYMETLHDIFCQRVVQKYGNPDNDDDPADETSTETNPATTASNTTTTTTD